MDDDPLPGAVRNHGVPRRLLLGALAAVAGAVTLAVVPAHADKPKLPDAAVKAIRAIQKTDGSASSNPNDISGSFDPTKFKGFPVIDVDPTTGKPKLDKNGKPEFVKNPDGTTKLFSPEDARNAPQLNREGQ